jgi:hypothetical protein
MQILDHYMEVANPKFTTKWLQGRKPRGTFCKQVKVSMPNHLQYAKPLPGARLQINEE